MNSYKAVLFDVDGTLLSFKTHEIAPSSLQAIKELQENGIACILATGRPTYDMPHLDIDMFDACITLNGQYCFVDDTVVRDEFMNPLDVARAVQQVDEGRYACLFMEAHRCYLSPQNENSMKLQELIDSIFPEGDYHEALNNRVYQLNVYVNPGEEDILLNGSYDIKTTRWSDLFVDVMPKSGGKEAGVLAICDYLGISPQEVVAFGDGGNDVGMVSMVGHGVAMGNGTDELKAVADAVTEDCDHDGIYNECKRLGLI